MIEMKKDNKNTSKLNRIIDNIMIIRLISEKIKNSDSEIGREVVKIKDNKNNIFSIKLDHFALKDYIVFTTEDKIDLSEYKNMNIINKFLDETSDLNNFEVKFSFCNKENLLFNQYRFIDLLSFLFSLLCICMLAIILVLKEKEFINKNLYSKKCQSLIEYDFILIDD